MVDWLRRIAKNAALAATAVAITLLASEFALRFALRDITTTSDNRSYFALRWKDRSVRLNALGFREREVSAAANGDYRIALVGDSFAFGQGIEENERLSNLIESRMRKNGRNVEVLNFGRAGNNSLDETRVVDMVAEKAAPDFVLIQWFVNDVEVPLAPAAPPGEPAAPRPSAGLQYQLKQQLRNHSVLYFLAAEVSHGLLERSGRGYVDDTRNKYLDPQTPYAVRAQEAFDGLVKRCREAAECAVVLVPSLAPIEGEYPFQFLHDRVIASCSRAGVVSIDLLDTFRPYLNQSDYQRLWVNRFDSHMSAYANGLAADRVVQELSERWRHSHAGATGTP